jgi:hypothetical protein
VKGKGGIEVEGVEAAVRNSIIEMEILTLTFMILLLIPKASLSVGGEQNNIS